MSFPKEGNLPDPDLPMDVRLYFFQEADAEPKASANARFQAFFLRALSECLSGGRESGAVCVGSDRIRRIAEGEQPGLRHGPHGKPYFSDDDLAAVYFSVSDTKACRAVGFASREIGVDIENVRLRGWGEERLRKIAERCYLPDELRYLETGEGWSAFPDAWNSPMPADLRDRRAMNTSDAAARLDARSRGCWDTGFSDGWPLGFAERFYRIWTMKEAYMKYTGNGFSEGFWTFSTLDVRAGRAGPEMWSARAPGNADIAVAVCADSPNPVREANRW